ncbi:MAG TPA: flagellar protein FlgN [Novosphingobium sp.]|nr:flagellar protein FlgN [Novosphingobium sp.]HZV11359.1 flagellar protein FlgN [Novosphingobium sp.]
MSVPQTLRETLRQMVSVLESERQALAGLDLDGIVGCVHDKQLLCGLLEENRPEDIDDECRGLLDAARRLNEVNRQLRNLIAANVAARLEAITGSPAIYRAHGGPAYAYAGGRA